VQVLVFFFRNILRQVLGFVDVFGLRLVVWSDCVADLFIRCEVKVNLVMWVCGR
jgi:hypothetical protein